MSEIKPDKSTSTLILSAYIQSEEIVDVFNLLVKDIVRCVLDAAKKSEDSDAFVEMLDSSIKSLSSFKDANTYLYLTKNTLSRIVADLEQTAAKRN